MTEVPDFGQKGQQKSSRRGRSQRKSSRSIEKGIQKVT